jgi:PAS domain S-box-containing protein
MGITGSNRKKKSRELSKGALTDDTWKARYSEFIKLNPLSIIEIEGDFVVNLSDEACKILEIKKNSDRLSLTEIFNDAKPAAFKPLQKEYLLHLDRSGAPVLLTRIIDFNDNEGLYDLKKINALINEKLSGIDKPENSKTQLEEIPNNRMLDYKQNEAKLRLLIQTVPIAFYIFEKSNRASIWYSEQIESLCGFSSETLRKNPRMWESRINEDDYLKVKGVFDHLKPNEHISCEYRWKDEKNNEIWIYDQAVLLEASESHPAQVIGCFMDISDRKQAEISVAESERNYREIFNSSNDAILILNAQSGLIEDVNETMLFMFGISYEKALNANLSLFLTGNSINNIASLKRNMEQALVNEKTQFECQACKNDGTILWVNITLKTVVIDSEAKIMAVIRDIDQEKNQEEHILYKGDFEKLLLDISSRFINIPDREVNKSIETALKDICSFTNTSAGFILIFRENENDTNQIFLWQSEKLSINKNDFLNVPYAISNWFLNQIRANKNVEVFDVNDFPEEAVSLKKLILRQKIRSFIDVPLFYQNKAIGFLGIAIDKPNRQWSTDEISLLKIVGQTFVNALKRKESVQLILENEQNYREIYNATTEAIIVHDIENGSILDVNAAFLEMFGYEYEEIKNAPLSRISAEKNEYEIAFEYKPIKSTVNEGPRVFEWLAKRKDHSVFWVEISLKSAEIRGVKRVLSVIRDISERKATEEKLKINEEKFRLMIEGQTDLIIKLDNKGRFLFVSPSYCDLFNRTEVELIGSNFTPEVHQDDLNTLEKIKENLKIPPYSYYLEQLTQTTKGLRWISWNTKAIRNDKNEISEILAVGRDTTYQKGVEEALRNSEDRFRSIVQRLSDIIFICDSESYIIYDTPNVDTLLGYQEGFLVGQKLLNLIHPEDLSFAQDKLKELLQTENHTVKAELRLINANGDIIPMEGTGINLLHYSAIKGLVVTLRDITERKQMDKKILDAVIKTEEQERERFAKNLHDDLGPLLSSIKMYISSLATSKETGKQEYIISQLNEVVKEAITTTKDVSNDLSPHILINYGLFSAIENFIQKIPSSIKVYFECSLPSERYSSTIENSFYRITKELINNSLKHAHASCIKINLTESGQELSLSYIDNGIGVDLNKSMSSNSKGMGISNIISRAKSLNGKYQFHSEKDQGFSFIITIPIHQPLD